jgi:acetyl esterase/lipase
LTTTTIPRIPDSLYRLMDEIGPRWGSTVQANVRTMIEAYSEILKDAPKEGTAHRELPYGTDPRQRLDVYEPNSNNVSPRPILMFVHGGAFVEGDKDRTDEIYSNVLWYFARHGIVGVNVEFRLAPTHTFPSGTEDIAAAVAWVKAHAADYGGDPDRIFLMGHSAGGAHSAHYAYDTRYHPAGGHGLAGLIVVSGRVRAENSIENPNAKRVEAYYGTSLDDMAAGSAISHVSAGSLPTMIAVAQYENPLIDVHCAELFSTLSQIRRRAPRFVWLPRHNHTSIIAHFNTHEDVLGKHVLEFMETGV